MIDTRVPLTDSFTVKRPSSYLTLRYIRSMNTLSRQRPLSSVDGQTTFARRSNVTRNLLHQQRIHRLALSLSERRCQLDGPHGLIG